MEYFLKIKEIQSYLNPFKELFILLGVIIIVWAIVALIIKKWIRKSDETGYPEDFEELNE